MVNPFADRFLNRDAESGEFVTPEYAAEHPATTVTERQDVDRHIEKRAAEAPDGTPESKIEAAGAKAAQAIDELNAERVAHSETLAKLAAANETIARLTDDGETKRVL